MHLWAESRLSINRTVDRPDGFFCTSVPGLWRVRSTGQSLRGRQFRMALVSDGTGFGSHWLHIALAQSLCSNRLSSLETETQPDDQIHAFLLRAAELLHQYGTPSFRLEGVMAKVAASLGLPSVFLYTPTALVVGIGQGEEERTYVRRVDSGDVDISKLLQLDSTLEDLEAGRVSVQQAAANLEAVAAAPPPFKLPVSLTAAAAACGGVAVIIGGSWIDTLIAGLFGFVITYLSSFPRIAQRGLLEPVLGFTVAICSVALAQWLPVNDRLLTLAALILPIPGLTLTIALTELALRHLSSGSARLAGAMVTLLTLVVGVAIAWRISADWISPGPGPIDPLPTWCLWVAVGTTPLAFAVVFRAPISQWPAIALVVVSGFVASRFLSNAAGAEVGAFAGAFVVGCGSNTYARLCNRPAMIPQTPGLLILVPGAIGYKSLTAMVENDTIRGVELAFSMSIVGVALVGGLLLANQVISPKRIL